MNIGQLRFVTAVARNGSFSRAAEECHVTQPTLSNGVAQLEVELGSHLFERTTRRVSLTSFGKHLLPIIEQVLAGLHELERSAEAYLKPEVKLIRIGLSPLVDMPTLMQLIEPFRKSNPDVELLFKECFLNDLDERLAIEQLDVVIRPEIVENEGRSAKAMETVPLYTDPLLYLSKGGIVVDGSALNVRALRDETLILPKNLCGLAQLTERILNEAGVESRSYPGQALSYAVMEDWAEMGIGAAVLPRSKLTDRSRWAVPLLQSDGRPALLTIVTTWSRTSPAAPAVQSFRNYLSDLATAAK